MPFSPSDIPGLKIRLEADAIGGLSDGDPVTTWADASGEANDFGNTSTLRPTYQTAELNGLPVVRFDGTDDYLFRNDVDSDFPSAATVFVVARFTGTESRYALFEVVSIGGGSYWGYSDGATYIGTFRADRAFSSNVGIAYSDSHVFSVLSSASTWQMWQDGVSLGTASANYDNGATSTEEFRIGASFVGDAYFGGDIGAVLAYDSALSTPDRETVEAYLNAKWLGIGSIPSGPPPLRVVSAPRF